MLCSRAIFCICGVLDGHYFKEETTPELGGGVKGTRGLMPIDIGIKHLEVSTNDNRAYALFKKR